MVYELLRFKKVVEAGSISKASRLLFISQPALSKSIQLLEQYYGVTLLERSPTGIRPTVYGDILYRSSCEMERCALQIERDVLEEKSLNEPDHDRKEVNIGCSTIWNDVLLPEVMRTIGQTDSYEIHVTSDTSEQLLNDLLEKQAYDFVLCRIVEDERYNQLRSVPLFESQPAVFVSEQHPIFRTGSVKERLNRLKWVKLRSLPALTKEDLTPAGLSLVPDGLLSSAISFEVEDLMAAIQLLQDNYAILLPLAFAGLLEKYSIKPLPFPTAVTNAYWLGMVHSGREPAPLYVRDLMNRIRLYFNSQSRA